ncbi:hypothetical protein SNF32_03705 [Enterococcus mundtii]|nr:hypothetical protein [Enterococcus mundtii]
MGVKDIRKIDLYLLVPYLLISVIGLLMIYSASTFRLMSFDQSTNQLLVRQMVFVALSWAMIFSFTE